jgi:hypothetical protein
VLRDELEQLKRNEKQRGWDSNRGIAGDVSSAWGAYEGAGPLCRSASSFSERDFECPPSPPLKEVLSVEFAREWGRKVGFTACDSLF